MPRREPPRPAPTIVIFMLGHSEACLPNRVLYYPNIRVYAIQGAGQSFITSEDRYRVGLIMLTLWRACSARRGTPTAQEALRGPGSLGRAKLRGTPRETRHRTVAAV